LRSCQRSVGVNPFNWLFNIWGLVERPSGWLIKPSMCSGNFSIDVGILLKSLMAAARLIDETRRCDSSVEWGIWGWLNECWGLRWHGHRGCILSH
jgi:hypothetical protein